MNNLKIVILIFSILSITGKELSGQEFEFPSSRIGITPTSLLNLFPAVQMSFDKGIRPRTNISLETGFVFNSSQNAKGFRVRPGIEYIITRGEYAGLSIGLNCNYRYSLEYRNIIRETRTGQYIEILYNKRRSIHYVGLNFSSSLIFKLSKKWYFEIGGGAGLATYQVLDERPLMENERFQRREPFFTPNSTVTYYPILYPHLNFSYAISSGKSKKR